MNKSTEFNLVKENILLRAVNAKQSSHPHRCLHVVCIFHIEAKMRHWQNNLTVTRRSLVQRAGALSRTQHSSIQSFGRTLCPVGLDFAQNITEYSQHDLHISDSIGSFFFLFRYSKSSISSTSRRNSSVGRALDWRSKGPWFDPGFRQLLLPLPLMNNTGGPEEEYIVTSSVPCCRECSVHSCAHIVIPLTSNKRGKKTEMAA